MDWHSKFWQSNALTFEFWDVSKIQLWKRIQSGHNQTHSVLNLEMHSHSKSSQSNTVSFEFWDVFMFKVFTVTHSQLWILRFAQGFHNQTHSDLDFEFETSLDIQSRSYLDCFTLKIKLIAVSSSLHLQTMHAFLDSIRFAYFSWIQSDLCLLQFQPQSDSCIML